MIEKNIINQVRNGICAVGFINIPLAEYLKDNFAPVFQIIGTGFLVRQTTVVTNRHVIDALMESQKNIGFPDDQFFLSFIVADEKGFVRNTIRMIRGFATLDSSDIGFIEFNIVNVEHFAGIEPLSIVPTNDLILTEEIAVCGYPYGTLMLEKDGRIYRWGAIIQQGFISALSPYDGSKEPDEILMDIRTARGMSGAPIFRPSNGEVVGIHYAGWEATTALGIPISKPIMSKWLDLFDKYKSNPIQIIN